PRPPYRIDLRSNPARLSGSRLGYPRCTPSTTPTEALIPSPQPEACRMNCAHEPRTAGPTQEYYQHEWPGSSVRTGQRRADDEAVVGYTPASRAAPPQCASELRVARWHPCLRRCRCRPGLVGVSRLVVLPGASLLCVCTADCGCAAAAGLR